MDHAYAGVVTQDCGSTGYKNWTEQQFGECLLIQLKVLLEGPSQQRLSLSPRLQMACLFLKFVFLTYLPYAKGFSTVHVCLCYPALVLSDTKTKSV